MAERYEYFKSDPAILDLQPELALARTQFERFMATFITGQTISADLGGELRAWFDSLSRIAERAHKLLYGEQYTLTIDAATALQAQYRDLLERACASGLSGDGLSEWFAVEVEKLAGAKK